MIVTDAPIKGRPVAVDGDAIRFAQIVDNLLTNAIKYTPAGGHIEVSVVREATRASAIVVRDDGIGIAANCYRGSSICSHRPRAPSIGRAAAWASASPS